MNISSYFIQIQCYFLHHSKEIMSIRKKIISNRWVNSSICSLIFCCHSIFLEDKMRSLINKILCLEWRWKFIEFQVSKSQDRDERKLRKPFASRFTKTHSKAKWNIYFWVLNENYNKRFIKLIRLLNFIPGSQRNWIQSAPNNEFKDLPR